MPATASCQSRRLATLAHGIDDRHVGCAWAAADGAEP